MVVRCFIIILSHGKIVTGNSRVYAGIFDNIVELETIPNNRIDTNDATAYAANIQKGYTAYARGNKITGSLVPLDTSDATAVASDIKSGKTAYVNGKKLFGSLLSLTSTESISSMDELNNGDNISSYQCILGVDSYGSRPSNSMVATFSIIIADILNNVIYGICNPTSFSHSDPVFFGFDYNLADYWDYSYGFAYSTIKYGTTYSAKVNSALVSFALTIEKTINIFSDRVYGIS